ncbi:MAG TPA: acetate--CoA ligase family protein [Actinomycetes bacterium]|nr:acetate--CoA ligase family protein [Actinomycetes bacterium]
MTATVAPAGLRALWSARAVAIVGASQRAGSMGRLPVEFLRRYGYSGRILPINPSADAVLELPCYPTVTAAPGPVDLALILLGADRVPAAIEDCIAAGVRVAIIGASGFAETGAAGAAKQDELVRLAAAGGLRLVGPNCIGAVGVRTGQVASFSPLFAAPTTELVAGSLGFVTQSGALGYGTVSLAFQRGLGLGWIINTGNEADVDAIEAMTAVAAEPVCTGVLGYVETLADGPGLRRLAASGVPIGLLKAGSSWAGARAAASHTAALATEDRVVEDVLRQLGIARTHDVEALLDLGDAFSQPRRPAGPRIAVLTTSGGSGILAADALVDRGLRLAEFGPETQAGLDSIVPAFGATANPVDVTATVMADPALFGRCLDLLVADSGVDALLACFCVLTGAEADQVVGALAEVAAGTPKPVFAARTGADHLAPGAAAALRAAGIPTFPTPGRTAAALAGLYRVSQDRPAVAAGGIAPAGGPATTSEPELKGLLRAAGIPVPAGGLLDSADDAAAAVVAYGGTAVFKAVVPGLMHKTEVGGVFLGVTPESASAAYQKLAALGGEVYAEEQVSGGAEVLVGVAPTSLGQVLTLASGGLLTEVIDDAVHRLLPIGPAEAKSMLAQWRGAAVLAGPRGRPELDAGALKRLLLAISELVSGWRPGYELDLNPVAVLPRGVVVLDAAYLPAGGPAQ